MRRRVVQPAAVFLLFGIAAVLAGCGSSAATDRPTADPFSLGFSYAELEIWLQERDIETWMNDPELLAGQTWSGEALIELSGSVGNIRTARLRFGRDPSQKDSEVLEALLIKLTLGEFSSLSELVNQVSLELPYETSEAITYTDKLRVMVERSVITDRIQITITRK